MHTTGDLVYITGDLVYIIGDLVYTTGDLVSIAVASVRVSSGVRHCLL